MQINKTNILLLFLFAIVALLFVLLASTTTSPLYQDYHFWYHHDSGAFQEMGLLLLQGGIPYLDLFDNKGTIMYFFQALGLSINRSWGISLLQSLLLFLTIIIWYNTSLLFSTSKSKSVLIIGMSLIYLLCYIDRGNMTEEWSLFFISYSIFLLINCIHNDIPLSSKTAFVIGLNIGIVSFIRINNNAPIIGFFIVYLFQVIKNKRILDMFCSVAFIIVGVLIVFAACIGYYWLRYGLNGVYEMLYGTFLCNFEYITEKVPIRITTRLMFYSPILLLITLLLIIPLHNNQKAKIGLLMSFFVTILSFGSHLFTHYFMVYVPLICITLSLCVAQSKTWICIGIIALSLSQSIRLGWSQLDCMAFRMLKSAPVNNSFVEFHDFIHSIPADETKSIYNKAAIWPSYFVEENIVQCNRIMQKYYPQRIGDWEKVHGISENKPIWILMDRTTINGDDTLIKEYLLVKSLYIDKDTVDCYHRIYVID